MIPSFHSKSDKYISILLSGNLATCLSKISKCMAHDQRVNLLDPGPTHYDFDCE